MKQFILNGKNYPVAEMDTNMICDFEDAGISMSDIQNKSFSFVRAYIASCMGVDVKTAGKEINNHVINGGSLEDLFEVIGEAMNNSGFFQALNKTQKKTNGESKTA